MTTREQAEYYRICLAMGLVRRGDVIRWADERVMAGVNTPDVIDVSLAVGADDYELDGVLKAVRGDGNVVAAAHAALGRLKAVLRQHTLREAVEKVVSYGQAAMVPDPEHSDAILFGTMYEYMLEGYAGSEAQIWKSLEAFVASHALESPEVSIPTP